MSKVTNQNSTLDSRLITTYGTTSRLNSHSGRKIHIEVPFFLECGECIKDDFWKSVFTDAAQGKWPRNFSYINNQIVWKKNRGKGVITLVVPDNPAEAMSKIKNFLKNYGGIRSKLDLHREQEEKTNSLDQNELLINKSWSGITKKTTKKYLLNEFCRNIAQQFSITVYEYRQLITVVNQSLMSGRLTNKDVRFNNGIIISINGLLFNNNLNIFFIDTRRKRKKIAKFNPTTNQDLLNPLLNSPSDTGKCFSFLQHWADVIKAIDKNTKSKFIGQNMSLGIEYSNGYFVPKASQSRKIKLNIIK